MDVGRRKNQMTRRAEKEPKTRFEGEGQQLIKYSLVSGIHAVGKALTKGCCTASTEPARLEAV